MPPSFGRGPLPDPAGVYCGIDGKRRRLADCADAPWHPGDKHTASVAGAAAGQGEDVPAFRGAGQKYRSPLY